MRSGKITVDREHGKSKVRDNIRQMEPPSGKRIARIGTFLASREI